MRCGSLHYAHLLFFGHSVPCLLREPIAPAFPTVNGSPRPLIETWPHSP